MKHPGCIMLVLYVEDKWSSYQSCVVILRSFMLVLLHHACKAAGVRRGPRQIARLWYGGSSAAQGQAKKKKKKHS